MKKTFMVSAASLLIALGACTSFEEVKQQADCGWPRKLDNLTWCKMPVKLT